MPSPRVFVFALTVAVLSGHVMAQQDTAVGTDFTVNRANTPDRPAVYSPFVGQEYPNRVCPSSNEWNRGSV
jgi:hypothetical protein